MNGAAESVADLADLDRNSLTTWRPGARWARRILLRQLEGLRDGRLRWIESPDVGEGLELVFGSTGDLDVTVRVDDERFYSKVIFGGTIGAGESYMAGHWEADDLTAAVRLLVRNRDLLTDLDDRWTKLTAPLQRCIHLLRRNTRSGSRRNISAHYDLSNDFFRLFLDERMMYSCAVYERPDATLEEASLAKIERICRKLDLRPEDHVLEIGTGWGSFALYAALVYGCRVTTTTISPEQASYARQRIRNEGLDDRVEVMTLDYRDLEGRYDKLVSIEMIEAVGLENLDRFFAACNRLLKPEGVMLLQSITIADRLYENARQSVDFIQRYIFPGSALPSPGALSASIARSSDLVPIHLEDIGPHYATTLKHWRERFESRREEIRSLGFSDRFLRMWEFYFCYCEGGFLERSISDVQILLAGPDCRRPPLLGQLAEAA